MTHTQIKPMTIAEFRAWYAKRPQHERWELIDGERVQMMTPPTKRHQQVAYNLNRVLDDGLNRLGSPLRACQRVGVNLGIEHYDPEPDVLVVDDSENPTSVMPIASTSWPRSSRRPMIGGSAISCAPTAGIHTAGTSC